MSNPDSKLSIDNRDRPPIAIAYIVLDFFMFRDVQLAPRNSPLRTTRESHHSMPPPRTVDWGEQRPGEPGRFSTTSAIVECALGLSANQIQGLILLTAFGQMLQ